MSFWCLYLKTFLSRKDFTVPQIPWNTVLFTWLARVADFSDNTAHAKSPPFNLEFKVYCNCTTSSVSSFISKFSSPPFCACLLLSTYLQLMSCLLIFWQYCMLKKSWQKSKDFWGESPDLTHCRFKLLASEMSEVFSPCEWPWLEVSSLLDLLFGAEV